MEHKYCWNCGKKLGKGAIRDAEGHYFCDGWCRREWWQEVRKDNEERLKEFYRGWDDFR